MPIAYFAAGAWAIIMLAIFIWAIRLSYRIEARSPGLANRSGFPRNAMIFHTVFNMNVARDEETQAMRRRMIRLLLLAVLGLGAMGGVLHLFQAGAGS